MKYKIGTKIILRSNEDEPYSIGKIIEHDVLANTSDIVPLVELSDGKQVLCLSIHVPYSDNLVYRLNKLNPKQQYELLWAIRANDKGKKFILMRGLPGSGKSTRARFLAGDSGQVFSTDDFFCLNEEQEYRFNGKLLGKAHQWNQDRSLAALDAEIPIVVIDNTHTTIKEMRSYLPHIREARLRGYQVSIEEPNTTWALDIEECFIKGTHNVPKDHLRKMHYRYCLNVDVEHVLFDVS